MRDPAPQAAASGSAAQRIALTTRHTLPNGIVALLYHNASSPTVSVRGEVRTGAVNEPPEQSGLATFTAAALIRGTATRTFQQITSETESRGCSVHASGGTHVSSFSGKALSEDLPLVLEILADMIARPTFPEHEIERLRAQFLMGLRENEQEPSTQAVRAALAMLYPPEHPYSRLSSGTTETVQQLGRDNLAAFHRAYHPAATTIAIVGDVQPETAIAHLEHYFGGWDSASPSPTQHLPAVPPLAGVQRRDTAMAGKTQSEIIWGVHGLARTDPDYYPAMVANMILGQLGMGGRMGDNVRDTQGLAYHVYTSVQAGLGAGPWVAAAGVSPETVDQTVAAMLHEIERFKQEGPTDEELSDARAYLTGRLAIILETNGGIANTLLDIESYALGLDFIERYPAIINSVGTDDIIAVVRKYLSTESYVLAVAGPPSYQ